MWAIASICNELAKRSSIERYTFTNVALVTFNVAIDFDQGFLSCL